MSIDYVSIDQNLENASKLYDKLSSDFVFDQELYQKVKEIFMDKLKEKMSLHPDNLNIWEKEVNYFYSHCKFIWDKFLPKREINKHLQIESFIAEYKNKVMIFLVKHDLRREQEISFMTLELSQPKYLRYIYKFKYSNYSTGLKWLNLYNLAEDIPVATPLF